MSGELPDIGSVDTTQIDGLQIRFALSGSTNGTPVLLTSPWPESIYAFRDVLFEVGKSNPLIAMDLPGYGRSQGRQAVMSPESMGICFLNAAERFGKLKGKFLKSSHSPGDREPFGGNAVS